MPPHATTHTARVCETCGCTFLFLTSRLKHAPGRFCSQQCRYAAYGTLEDRFWKRVEKTDTCWGWSGPFNRKGYGWLTVNRRPFLAHRFSYQLHIGPIPDDMFVCHHCDNPACVRPEHLFLGTNLDNMRDMYAKGRGPTGQRSGRHTHPERTARGERQGSAKLTEAKVREIRQRFAAGGISQTALAAEYGVDRSTVGWIIRGKHWRHVKP